MRKFEYKYRVDEEKKTVVALSTFAGKVVRGVARCDPQDDFNVSSGKELAGARCSVRIAEKRMKRAEDCFTYAKKWLEDAQKYYQDMLKYNEESVAAYNLAVSNLAKVESKM